MDRRETSVFIETTMLELVSTLGDELEDEREVVHIVQQMIAAGRVRLIGTFRDDFGDLQIEEPGSEAPRERGVFEASGPHSARDRPARTPHHQEGDRP